MQTNIINLDETLIIGEGTRRTVYLHPQNKNKCIKIAKLKTNENYHDIKYFKHLNNRNASLKHIAKFYDEVNTNYGSGIVFELVKDFDDKISKTLDFYLNQSDTNLNNKIIENMLGLKSYLLSEKIVFVDIKPGNIVAQKIDNSKIKLVIVDGLGSRNFIPVAHYIGVIARSMIGRRWHRTMRHNYKIERLFEK